jgi:uncharacterized protein
MIERALAFYKRWLSPALHSMSRLSGACRFCPSCSEYAAAALEQHGFVLGSGLAIWRLLRCNPFSRGGFDPVPGTYFPAKPMADSEKCGSEPLSGSPAGGKRAPSAF